MPTPDIVKSDIALQARERADMVGSTFVSDAEVLRYADQAWEEFWMILVSKFEDFFLVKADITLTIGQSYVLPNDFLKIRGVRHANKEFLRRIDLKELPSLFTGLTTQRPTNYYVRGDPDASNAVLELVPLPNAAYAMELFYTPVRSMEDMFVGSLRLVALWKQYIVLSVALKLKDKEESDCSVILAEREMLLDLITRSMTPLDSGEPFAVVQTTQRSHYYNDPFLYEEVM